MRTPMIEARDASIYTRIYGASSQPVLLVHDGPGMPGSTAALGWHLQDSWRVIEYHQRGAGRTKTVGPIRVKTHVEDLRAVVRATCGDKDVVLVGCGWGGVLSLSFAADHPGWVKKVILVGCAGLSHLIGAELTPEQTKRVGGRAARRIGKLVKSLADEDLEEERSRLFAEIWELSFPLYRCSPDTERPELADISHAAYRETMQDAIRLRESGALYTDYDKITIPVVAFHGDHDPDPAPEVKGILESRLGNLRFLVLKNCGRFPWLEPHAKALFLRALREQLAG